MGQSKDIFILLLIINMYSRGIVKSFIDGNIFCLVSRTWLLIKNKIMIGNQKVADLIEFKKK